MANKYSSFNLKPYVSQYVDTGKVDASQILRERWETNKAEHDKLTRAANTIEVGGGDQHLKDSAVEGVRQDFEGIISNNNYEDASRIVSDATTKFLSNEGLQVATQSYQNWKKGEETRAQLEMQGVNVLFDKEYVKDEQGNIVYDENGTPQTVNKFDQHSSFYQDENGKMVRNIYQPNFQQQLHYDERQKKIIGTIAKDPIALQSIAKATGLLASDIEGYLMYGKQLTSEKANRIADAFVDQYLETSEGVQQMRKLTENDIDPATGNNYDNVDARFIIQQEMRNIAQGQVDTTVSYVQDPLYAAMLENQSTNTKKRMETYWTNATKNSAVVTGNDFIDVDKDFDENGNLSSESFSPSWATSIWGQQNVYHEFLQSDYADQGISRADAGIKAQAEVNRMLKEYMETNDITELSDTKGNKHFWRKVHAELFSMNDEKADVRLRREMEAAKAEGRQPKMHILASHKPAYIKYMREQYTGAGLNVSDMSDKEFVTKMSDAQERYEVTAQKVYAPSNVNLDGQKESILRNNDVWHLRRADGSITQSKEDALIELGFKNGKGKWNNGMEEQYDKYIKDILTIRGITTAGSSAGSFVAKFRDANGKDVEIEIQAGNSQQQIFQAPHAIIEDLMSGNAMDHVGLENAFNINSGIAYADSGEMIKAVQDVYYKVDPKTFAFIPVIRQSYYHAESNEFIKAEEVSGMEQVEIMMSNSMTQLQNSGILGTDYTVGKKSEASNPAT